MKSYERLPGGCSRPEVQIQRRHGHPVLTLESLAQSGRLMSLSTDNAMIPCSPPDGLSVEGSMICAGSNIQVHKAWTVY